MSEPTAANKARSENEGLDSIANEVSEIEAGDLTDGKLKALPLDPIPRIYIGRIALLRKQDPYDFEILTSFSFDLLPFAH